MSTFSPDKIQLTKKEKQPFILIYAPNGHGKTSFLASMGKPFILDTEDKCNQIDAPRYVPENFQAAIDCLKYLLACETFPAPALAIDTLDWLEKRIHENICNTYKNKDGSPVSNINEATHEQLNFGKGSKIAANEFNAHILSLLIAIRDKHNIPIILCAQQSKVPVNQPDRDKHDIIDLRLEKVLSAFISDIVEAKLYLDCRFFKDHKGAITPSDERYFVTKPKRGIAAKNSLHLPSEITIGEFTGWADFIKALQESKLQKQEVA